LEKPKQKYITFIKLGSAGSKKLYEEIMKWKDKPMGGVKLEEAYQVFGKWDFAVLFEADLNENALHFVGDIVRPIEGVAATRTIPVAPLRKWG
jgi:uncharacterized protein with GYD domain